MVHPPQQHQVIQWFWDILEHSFDNNDRSKFLMFAWGRSRLPLDEKDLTMEMEIIGDKIKTAESLPTSATCFFRVTLSPWYESKEQLEKALLISMANEDMDGDEMAQVDRGAFQ